VPKKIEALRG
jgi:uncharacterized protein YjbJ (UPF0337 family)